MLGNSYNVEDYRNGDYNTETPDEHIEKTAFRFPLMSEEWIREIDSDIVVGTYRHKIILLPYILGYLLLSLLGLVVGYSINSIPVMFASVILPLTVVLFGLFKYWSVYYVMTEGEVIRITGLYTGSTDKRMSHNKVVESECEIPFFGRTLNVLLDWGYGHIVLKSPSDSPDISGSSEQTLDYTKNARDFREIEKIITDSE